MTERENYLRCVRFEGPDWIPCSIGALPVGWKTHREGLLEIALSYPDLFGKVDPHKDFDEMPSRYRKGHEDTDNWGVVWRTEIEGIIGIPQVHPLADLSKIDEYHPPDPLTMCPDIGPRDWEAEARRMREAKAQAKPVISGYGTLFERLQELVGMEKLLTEMAQEDNPPLQRVVDLVVDFHLVTLEKIFELATPDVVGSADDLGSQRSALVSPRTFRRWLKPAYQKLWQFARSQGCEVSLHSDGYLLELVDDLIDAGLTILNPQVGGNTLYGIEETMKGRLAISLDLDRQHILPHGSEQEVRDHVREAVQVLGSPRGGLMLQAEINADVPLKNVRALAEAMREYQTYYQSTATPLPG